ncbi:MAG: MATE family efflux transporter [Planctomycetota bacterium]
MSSAPKPLLALAWPMIASFTTRFAFSLVDLVYARALLDEEPGAVAALGLYMPFATLYIAMWVGLSAGLTASLANAFGRRDAERIEASKVAVKRFLWVLAPITAILGGSLWFVIPAVGPSLGLEPELIDAFRVYGTVMLVGMPILGFPSVLPDSIVKAHHDTKTTMYAGFAASLTNIALNTIFVFVFSWGLFGIAFATVLSRLSAYGYSAYRARILEAARQDSPDWKEVRDTGYAPTRPPLPDILRLAVPAALTYVLMFVELILINRNLLSAEDSTKAIEAYGIFHQVMNLALMPTIATAVALVPFLGRAAAEGRLRTIRKDIIQGVSLSTGIALLITVPAGLIFPAEIASFFAKSSSDEGLLDSPLLLDALAWLPVTVLASLPYLLFRPVFEALQRPSIGVRLTLIRFLALSWPLVFLSGFAADQLDISRIQAVIGALTIACVATSLLTATGSIAMLKERAGSESPA